MTECGNACVRSRSPASTISAGVRVLRDTQDGASVMLLGAAAARALPQPVASPSCSTPCSADEARHDLTALSLLTLWLAGLAVGGAFIVATAQIDSDLRLFLPSPTTPEQRLLLDAIGKAPRHGCS